MEHQNENQQSQQPDSPHMNDQNRTSGASSDNRGKKKSFLSAGRFVITAAAFTLVGIIVASQLDFTKSTQASPDFKSGATPVVQTASGEVTSPFVPVIDKVKDAVVAVTGERENNQFGFFSGNAPKSTSSGTGFFFRPDGYVLTNNHVVNGAENIQVTTSSGFVYKASLVGLDPATDLAVLKVDTDDHLVHIPFGNSDSVLVGDWAIAIGNPFPQQGLFGSVTVGVISALGRAGLNFGGESPDYQSFIQVDASINPGNSGGPLLNLKGEAVGINSAISSPTGASVGIGFAVPINIARAIIPDLIAYGEVRRGWLGVSMASVTPADARRLHLDRVTGVVIEDVVPHSPAEDAGLRADDIVIEYNGHQVANPAQFSILVSTTAQGGKAEMKVIRDREKLTLTATIADKKSGELVAQEWQREQGEVETYDWMGMQLMTLTRSVAEQSGLDYVPGILVNGVMRNGDARRQGFNAGDVITEISGQRVQDLDQFKLAIKKFGGQSKVISMIVVDRTGNEEYRTLRL